MRKQSLVLAALVVVGTLVGCAPQAYVELSDVLSNPDLRNFTDPKENTDAVCASVVGCVEGWTTREAVFLRFDTVDNATHFAQLIGSAAYRSNQLVVDFTDSDVGAAERESIEQVIRGAHQSD